MSTSRYKPDATRPLLEASREALRLMEQRDKAQTLHKEEIRTRIAAGMASLRAGEGVDGHDFLAMIDAELAELERREPV